MVLTCKNVKHLKRKILIVFKFSIGLLFALSVLVELVLTGLIMRSCAF